MELPKKFNRDNITPADIEWINDLLEKMTAVERIAWAARNFGDELALLSSMQKTASMMMHIFYTEAIGARVIFVDTGFHFPETIGIRDLFAGRYGLNIVTISSGASEEENARIALEKPYLTPEGAEACCRERKVKPLIDYTQNNGVRFLLGGLRRADGGKRALLKFFQRDERFGGWRIFPILDYTDEDIERYLKENDVPINDLHDNGYPSIGCACCTEPVEPGDDVRSGRWAQINGGNGYCGINSEEKS